MNDKSIVVKGLSKQYKFGALQQRHDTLRDALMAGIHISRHYLRSCLQWQSLQEKAKIQNTSNKIWALKDISFEVNRGEVVGLIGHNGAGKSTLLKILSRITEPTSGEAEIRGRVGSLLEVGTGFHAELTGRENIYLSGAILGMKKSEIDWKFDEIVEFSGIGQYIDTPVKRYSSGMSLRLGFAIAAHLEPEILLVDEVLAVGDAQFHKQCLGKMSNIAGHGRTILFVSHNMVAIQSLCQRVVWLEKGSVVEQGPSAQVVSHYLRSAISDSNLTERRWDDVNTAPGNDIARLHRVCIRPEGETPNDPITMQTSLLVEIEYWNLIPDTCLHITLYVYNEEGILAFTTLGSQDSRWSGRPMEVGLFRSTCHIPGNLLNSGSHRILVLVVKDLSTHIFQLEDALMFDVADTSVRQGSWFDREPGAVQPLLEWRTKLLAAGISPT